jgi:hypothetical protein
MLAMVRNEEPQISTASLVNAWWYGQYGIYYTNRTNDSNLSDVSLDFVLRHPEDPTFMVGGGGTDGIGQYSIDNGVYDPKEKTISFIKRYINNNNNVAWNYKGIYKNNLFYGTWGTTAQPNRGNFIIKQTCLGPASVDGNWYGYYIDGGNNSSELMLLNLKQNNTQITGSGTDNVGTFTIQGKLSADNSISFVKSYPTQSWTYNGWKEGRDIYGAWGNAGQPSGGTFLLSRRQSSL